MPFLGTIVNFSIVLVLGIAGTLIKRSVPERITNAIIAAMATCVLFIGIDGALEAAPRVPDAFPLSAGLTKMLIMIISMGLGTLIGELIDIDKLLSRLGNFLEKKLCRDTGTAKGNFSKGFVSCSLLFCVGAMAVNGAIQDAVGKPDILIAKSVVDGIVVLIMSTTLGIGCAFSALSLLVYQGGITLIAYFASDFIPAATLSYMSVTGSLIIILIATNMLGLTKVKTANMIPAIFIPLLLAPIVNMF